MLVECVARVVFCLFERFDFGFVCFGLVVVLPVLLVYVNFRYI